MKKILWNISWGLLGIVVFLVALSQLGHHWARMDPEGFARIEREKRLKAEIERNRGIPTQSELFRRQDMARRLLREKAKDDSLRYQGYTEEEIERLRSR